jgi:predicted dehydrogenase
MDAFLRDEEMNFVYVASPNLLHYEQTKKALFAGKHVICEKPFCTKVSEARELVELAKEKGLFLIDAVPTTFTPNFAILKRELPKIGKVK